MTETKRIPSRAVETGVFVSIAASSISFDYLTLIVSGLTAFVYIAQAVSDKCILSPGVNPVYK